MIDLSSLCAISGITFEEVLADRSLKIEVDNRCLTSESLFIAIKGERFNPLDHLEKVVSAGCEYVLFESGTEIKEEINKYKGKIHFLTVKNIEESIAQIGKVVADRFKERGGKILAIAGSNGKTTTKEMVKALADDVLGKNSNICTQKNNNNHLGVPFTLFQITANTKFAIVELGSNSSGEIEFLCKILSPQYGVTTNIGDTHLEFFETRENVFKEESVISKYCSDAFFINQDDEFLKTLNPNCKTISYGENARDYNFKILGDAVEVNNSRFENFSLTGSHNFINLGLSVVMLKEIFKIDFSKLTRAAKDFKPTSNRSEWLKYNDKDIFLDAYNANPSSMKVAIEGFFKKIAPIEPSAVCVVLGDMNELGDKSKEMHQELGEFTQGYAAGQYVFVGRFSQNYLSGYAGDNAIAVETTQEAQEIVSKLPKSVKYLFIKGSRSLQLERILDIK